MRQYYNGQGSDYGMAINTHFGAFLQWDRQAARKDLFEQVEEIPSYQALVRNPVVEPKLTCAYWKDGRLHIEGEQNHLKVYAF